MGMGASSSEHNRRGSRPLSHSALQVLADGVDIPIIQLMLGHADVKQTQRYLNTTDEELHKAMTWVWEHRRQLRLSTSSNRPELPKGVP